MLPPSLRVQEFICFVFSICLADKMGAAVFSSQRLTYTHIHMHTHRRTHMIAAISGKVLGKAKSRTVLQILSLSTTHKAKVSLFRILNTTMLSTTWHHKSACM